MRDTLASVPILFGLLASRCLCQTNITPVPFQQDLTAYEYFLQDVVASDRFAALGSLPPSKPPLPQAIGLTDLEAQAVKAQARDYQAKNNLFLAAIRPLRKEALLQSLESGHESGDLTQRIRELENEQAKMVSAQIQNLKTSLGALRFDILDAFIRSRSSK